MKEQIRNPKHQIRRNFKIRILNFFRISSFGFGALIISAVVFTILPSHPILAQATQFYLEDTVDKWKVRIYVVGDTGAKAQVQEALYRAIDNARALFQRIDSNNPNGELSGINQKRIRGSYMVSEDLTKAVEAALEVSQWTNGAFDMTTDPTTAGNFRNVSVNRKNNEVKIKANNITLNLRPIMRGILADKIADDLVNAGWKNTLVKVGNVFAARGSDANGPWKIPVITPNDKLAKRALMYKATDVSAATLTTNDGTIDPLAPSDLKSVTIFTQSATKAEALAAAIYKMGAEEGKKFLAKNTNLRAVLGDGQGNLTHIPDWKQNP